MESVFFLILFIGMLAIGAFFIFREINIRSLATDADLHLNKGHIREAIARLRQLSLKRPDDIKLKYNLARLLVQDGKPQDAALLAKALLKRDLSGAEVGQVQIMLLLATAEAGLGDNAAAVKSLLTVSGMDKENTEANYKLALHAYARKDYPACLRYAKQALQADGSRSDALFMLGRSAFETQNYQEAVTALRKSFEAGFNPFESALFIAMAYWKMGQEAEANSHFWLATGKAATKLDRYTVHYEWASFLKTTSDFRKAVAHLEKARGFAVTPEQRRQVLAALLADYEKELHIPGIVKVLTELLSLSKNDETLRTKLAYYQDIHSNEMLKRYLDLPAEQFQTLCHALASLIRKGYKRCNTRSLDINTVDILMELVVEKANSQYCLVRFSRGHAEIGEMYVRELAETMRTGRAKHAVLVVNTELSQAALEFASKRNMEIISHDELLEYLDTVVSTDGWNQPIVLQWAPSPETGIPADGVSLPTESPRP